MPDLSSLEQKVIKDLEKRMATYEKSVHQALAQALDKMRAEMSKIYEKYSKGDVLTRVEMTKYNKYVTMEKQILSILDPAIKANIKTIKYLLPEMYNASFFEYAWAMDNGTGLRLSYGTINEKAIAELFSITNPKNLELMEALKNYGPQAKKWIRSALLNGLTSGKGYAAMVKDLKNALDKTTWQALRILRTEGQRAINTGQYDLYVKAKENGIMGNDVWDATLDHKTRQTHALLDGRKRNPGGFFIVGGYPALYPLDENLPASESIHCRCHLRFEIEGYEPQLRRTRDEGVIPYQTYDQWVKEYHPGWKI